MRLIRQQTYLSRVLNVVMSSFNSYPFTYRSVESILEQTYPDFNFTIIDDGSTDESVAVLESIRDDRVTLLRNDINRGLTKSLNVALLGCNQRFIARMDADDESHLQRFEYQIDRILSDDSLSLLGTQAVRKNISTGECEVTNFPNDSEEIREALRHYNCFVHGSVVFRKSCYDKAGGYNIDCKFAQDYDLWTRISLLSNTKMANLDEILYLNNLHQSSITSNDSVRQQIQFQASRERFIKLLQYEKK